MPASKSTTSQASAPAAQKKSAKSPKAPKSTAPKSTAPKSAAPKSVAPKSAAPKSATPKSATPKSAAPKSAAAVTVVAEPVATTEVVAPPTVENTVTDLESQFAAITQRLSELKSLESSILADVKKLQKCTTKYVKELSRKSSKRRSNNDADKKKRAPSGFAKPALISPALCSFLGQPTGTEMARTEVTKFLTSYIKTNELQDPSNRRKIIPDKKLQSLLNTKKSDEVTYFNLQKYMKVHFPLSAKAKSEAAAASASASV